MPSGYQIWQNKNSDQKVVSTHTQSFDGSWRLHYLDLDPLTASDVRRFRKSLGLKQDELAEFCGITVDGVRKWESGGVTVPAHWGMVFAAIAANLAPWPYSLPDHAQLKILSPLPAS